MEFLQGSVRPSIRARSRRARLLLVGLIVAAAGCGAGALPSASAAGPAPSSAALQVLLQTLTSARPVRSGVIGLDLRIVPRGSGTLTGPIELSLGGPFQSAGAGGLPTADLTLAVLAHGLGDSAQLISAGGHVYVTLGGQTFRLPASSYRRLASQLRSLTTSATHTGGLSTALVLLGVDPFSWLKHLRIVGHPRLDGAPTIHIATRIEAAALLRAVDRALHQAGSLGLSSTSTLAKTLSGALAQRLAQALGAPRLDVWVGSTDRALRRLRLSATVPVTGSTRTLLGGVRSAAMTLTLRFSQINQPQVIRQPVVTQPYSALRAEALRLLAQIEGGLMGTSGTSTTSTTAG
ncbi:MAG TPA: hypothetical protein VFN36_05220 [Solirubrobacteraceae bacterium]|nr:hypothetical protein [Solirubrobacteraceae bacterium]